MREEADRLVAEHLARAPTEPAGGHEGEKVPMHPTGGDRQS